MGIPGLYGKYLAKIDPRRQSILRRSLPSKISSVSFDLNGTIHKARAQVFEPADKDPLFRKALADAGEDQLHLEIQVATGNLILEIVNSLNPHDVLILAVDGPAPLAKLQQQKARRERSAQHLSEASLFDTNAITPGTDFMRKMDSYLVRFIAQNRDKLPHKVIYSSHLVPGEGEHKIMDLIRQGELSNTEGAHIIIGLDADLIMLSLLAPLENIFLVRDTITDVIDIEAFKGHLKEANPKSRDPIDDFVVVAFLLGNDFLPKQPAMEELAETIELLMTTTRKIGGNLTLYNTDSQRREINWTAVGKLIAQLGAQEARLLFEASKRPNKYPSRHNEAATSNGKFLPGQYRESWYHGCLGTKGSPDAVRDILEIVKDYKPSKMDLKLFPASASTKISRLSPVTQDRIAEMSESYLKTMAWIYLYYREGTAKINQEWFYPFYYTPLLADVNLVTSTLPENFDFSGYEAFDGMFKFTALHQLVAVLPLKSKSLLPIELQPLMSPDSMLRDMYPAKFVEELDGKDRDPHGRDDSHKATAFVPLIDHNRIVDAMTQVQFRLDRMKLWLPAETIINQRSQADIKRVEAQRARGSSIRAPLGRGDFSRVGRGDFGSRGRGDFGSRGTSIRGRGSSIRAPLGVRELGRGGYIPKPVISPGQVYTPKNIESGSSKIIPQPEVLAKARLDPIGKDVLPAGFQFGKIRPVVKPSAIPTLIQPAIASPEEEQPKAVKPAVRPPVLPAVPSETETTVKPLVKPPVLPASSSSQNLPANRYFFPPKTTPAQLEKLLMAPASQYSTTRFADSLKIEQELRNILKEMNLRASNLTATDATANIGGDTMLFHRLGFKEITSFEIDSETCRLLKNNLKVLGMDDTVTVRCEDWIPQLKKVRQDVLFIDAPWGGPDYWKHENLELYLSGQSLKKISRTVLKNKLAKVLILKLPINYHDDKLRDEYQSKWDNQTLKIQRKDKTGVERVVFKVEFYYLKSSQAKESKAKPEAKSGTESKVKTTVKPAVRPPVLPPVPSSSKSESKTTVKPSVRPPVLPVIKPVVSAPEPSPKKTVKPPSRGRGKKL